MLRDILMSRNAINGLKQLSTAKEAISKEEIALSSESAALLAQHDLLHEEGDAIIISLKGKQFVSVFDELKGLLEHKQSRVKLSFSLNGKEQDVLLYLSHVGSDIEIGSFIEKAKKAGVVDSKKSALSIIDAVEELRLIKKTGKIISITSLGKRTLVDALLEQFNLQ